MPLAVLLSAAVIGVCAAAQAQLPGIRLPSIPGLDQVFKKPPALSTHIGDAVFGVPPLDLFEPEFQPMDLTNRGPGGGVLLPPGAWEATLQSY